MELLVFQRTLNDWNGKLGEGTAIYVRGRISVRDEKDPQLMVEDICLLEIVRLRELYGKRVKAIGFSGHHLGIAVDSAAVALGAEWIERHFTLDRTWKGTDHAASLEPDGVRKLVRDAKAVYRALTYKREDILDIEKVQRDKLKKHQVKW